MRRRIPVFSERSDSGSVWAETEAIAVGSGGEKREVARCGGGVCDADARPRLLQVTRRTKSGGRREAAGGADRGGDGQLLEF